MISDILELKPSNSHTIHFKIKNTIKPIQKQGNPIINDCDNIGISFICLFMLSHPKNVLE